MKENVGMSEVDCRLVVISAPTFPVVICGGYFKVAMFGSALISLDRLFVCSGCSSLK